MTLFKKPEMLAFLGIAVFYNSWLLSFILSPKLSFNQSYVSELDVHGQPNVWFFRLGNLSGAMLLFSCFCLMLKFYSKKHSSIEQITLLKIFWVISLAAIINALFPMDCTPSQSRECFIQQQKYLLNAGQWIHLFMAIIMFGGLILANLYVVNRYKKKVDTNGYQINLISLTTQIILNVLIAIVSFTGYGPIGLLQRTSLLLFEVWVVYLLFDKKTAYFPKCSVNT